MRYSRTDFDGHSSIYKYEIDFPGGIKVGLTNYGASLISLAVPDAGQQREEVVLGFEALADYLEDHPYFGCTCGRFSNRIENGTFSLDGVKYQLERNNFPNHLHGGDNGFQKRVWEEAAVIEESDSVIVTFSYFSQHMESGYPGNLTVRVSFRVSRTGVEITYQAETDQSTIINLTNHSYFNLSGKLNAAISDHRLQINAQEYLPVSEYQIPTRRAPVKGTRFDFRSAKVIGEAPDFDHCFCLNHQEGELGLGAILSHDKSGRKLIVKTFEPGLQLYTGQYLDGSFEGKGYAYGQSAGLCLETQGFPNSPNEPSFPSTVLLAGEKFHSQTVLDFSESEAFVGK